MGIDINTRAGLCVPDRECHILRTTGINVFVIFYFLPLGGVRVAWTGPDRTGPDWTALDWTGLGLIFCFSFFVFVFSLILVTFFFIPRVVRVKCFPPVPPVVSVSRACVCVFFFPRVFLSPVLPVFRSMLANAPSLPCPCRYHRREKTVVVLGDIWWPQTAKQEGDRTMIQQEVYTSMWTYGQNRDECPNVGGVLCCSIPYNTPGDKITHPLGPG